MKSLCRLAAVIVALAADPVAAQWQTPTHTVPIGKGAGVTGFGNAAPGTAGLPLVSNGATFDPSFQLLSNAGLAVVGANTFKGALTAGAPTDLPLPSATCAGLGWTGGTGFTCAPASGFINPLNFGAKCDGATHDEVAFQNALNAAMAARAVMIVPLGNCVINANITSGTGSFSVVQIQGYGEGSLITFLGNFGFSFNAFASYYRMQDFWMTCQSSSTAPCVKIFNATGGSTADGSIIQNTVINGSGVYGWYFQSMEQTKFVNNTIVSTGVGATASLFIDNTISPDAGGNIIANNYITTAGGSTSKAISLLNSGGISVIGNSIGNAGGYDIDLYANFTTGSATGIAIQDNQFDNAGSAGIRFDTNGGLASRINMSGNIIQAFTSSAIGIFMNASASTRWLSSVAIANNQIELHGGLTAIDVFSTNFLSITGNNLLDGTTGTAAGITIQTASGGVGNCVISGNMIAQFSVGVINPGSVCVVAGNSP